MRVGPLFESEFLVELDLPFVEVLFKDRVNAAASPTRLQGLKDQLTLSDDPEAEELRQEVAELEQRIDDLTEVQPGSNIGLSSVGLS